VTLTAKVRPAAATGTVTFYSGTTVLETEPVSDGKATLNTILLPFGTQPLKAYYGGDGTYGASSSEVSTQTVNTVPGGSFQSVETYQTATGPFSIAVGDFNGDGSADMAIGTGVGVDVLLGNGDGTFQKAVRYLAPETSSAGVVAVGDFNSDGRPDLFFSIPDVGSANIFLGNGDGTFQAPLSFANGGGSSSVGVADFNGDGIADLVVTNSATTITVLLGVGDGTFLAPTSLNVGAEPVAMALGDFNGDGKTDLAIACVGDGGMITVLLGNGDGTFQTQVDYVAGSAPNIVVTADFNGDGKADLAFANGAGISVLLGNGDGTFQPPIGSPGSGGVPSAAVGDFNGDGIADLAVYEGETTLLLGNGDGTFRESGSYAGAFPGSIVIADFNGDGRADLASENESAKGAVGILLGLPAGETSTALEPNPNPTTYGQIVTLTATISPLAATGTVSFYSSTAALGKIGLNSGIAKLSISTLPGGLDPLIAVYSGDGTYPKSTSPTVTQTVNRASTFTGLTSSPNPSNFGQTVTFAATVSSTTATGTVTFYHGSTALGTSPVTGGTGALPISTLPVGAHSITATYSGDGNYEGSTSPPWLQTVKAATTTTLVSSPNPSNLNQKVTLSATVSPATATGAVTFYHGTTSMGTGTLSNGVATLAVSTLSAGQHSLTASYGGDANDAPSTSPAIIQTVD
jgi:hypothetical protein